MFKMNVECLVHHAEWTVKIQRDVYVLLIIFGILKVKFAKVVGQNFSIVNQKFTDYNMHLSQP